MSIYDLFNKKTSSGLFVPDASGFKEVIAIPGNGSFNAVASDLGYNSEQWFLHMDGYDPEAEIQGVGLEVFSGRILFVQTKKTVTCVDAAKLHHAIRNVNEDLLSSPKITSVLSDGVANHSLSVGFLSRVLNLENADANGINYAEKIEMYLFFTSGVLSDFQPADGLGEYAKQWKQLNPGMLRTYEQVAKKYWGNNHKQVLHEINIQTNN